MGVDEHRRHHTFTREATAKDPPVGERVPRRRARPSYHARGTPRAQRQRPWGLRERWASATGSATLDTGPPAIAPNATGTAGSTSSDRTVVGTDFPQPGRPRDHVRHPTRDPQLQVLAEAKRAVVELSEGQRVPGTARTPEQNCTTPRDVRRPSGNVGDRAARTSYPWHLRLAPSPSGGPGRTTAPPRAPDRGSGEPPCVPWPPEAAGAQTCCSPPGWRRFVPIPSRPA